MDQIEVQGDFLDKAAELIVKQFAKEGVSKKNVYSIEDKKKVLFFDDESSEEE